MPPTGSSDKAPEYHVRCLSRGKRIKQPQEEVARQLYWTRLIGALAYPEDWLRMEAEFSFGNPTPSRPYRPSLRQASV